MRKCEAITGACLNILLDIIPHLIICMVQVLLVPKVLKDPKDTQGLKDQDQKGKRGILDHQVCALVPLTPIEPLGIVPGSVCLYSIFLSYHLCLCIGPLGEPGKDGPKGDKGDDGITKLMF